MNKEMENEMNEIEKRVEEYLKVDIDLMNILNYKGVER